MLRQFKQSLATWKFFAFCRIILQALTKWKDAIDQSKFIKICELIFLRHISQSLQVYGIYGFYDVTKVWVNCLDTI